MYIIVRDDGVIKYSETNEIDLTDLPCKAFFLEATGAIQQLNLNELTAIVNGITMPLQEQSIYILGNEPIYGEVGTEISVTFAHPELECLLEDENGRFKTRLITSTQKTFLFRKPGRYKLRTLHGVCVPLYFYISDQDVLIK